MAMDMQLTEEQQTIIRELFKCHYTAKEAASITNLHYQRISAIFRGLKVSRISKYNRLNLIQNDQVRKQLNG